MNGLRNEPPISLNNPTGFSDKVVKQIQVEQNKHIKKQKTN